MSAPTPLSIELGRSVQAARKAARMTQAQLAEACGLERTSVTNIEAGRQHPRLDVLVAMAAALKLEPADLVFGSAIVAVSPCCGNWSTCKAPCVPRANHYRDKAAALQETVHELNAYIARAVVRRQPAARDGCEYAAEPGKVCKKCWHVHAESSSERGAA